MSSCYRAVVEVEAQQVPEQMDTTGRDEARDIAEWCEGRFIPGPEGPYIRVTSWYGDVDAESGDWIVLGVKAEFFVIPDDIFKATYELVPS